MKFKIILFLSLLPFLLGKSLQATIKACSEREKFIINKTVGYFSQRTEPKLLEQELVHMKKYYHKFFYEISANNAGVEQKSEFFYYKSLVGSKEKKPTILLFSGIQGVSILERYVASKLAKKGFSIIISSQKGISHLDHIKKVKPFLATSVFSSLNLVDFASQMKGVDSENISLIGISLGGFRALYLSLIDLRVKANVLVISGLSIAKAITYSSLGVARELRTKQMSALGLDEEKDKAKYLELLQKELPFNAKDLVCRRKTSDYFLFQSKKDTAVPYRQQSELHRVLGYPRLERTKLLGHKGAAVLFALTGLSDSLEFIRGHYMFPDFESDLPLVPNLG